MDLHSKIASFLKLGYFMDYPKRTVRFPDHVDQVNKKGLSEEDLFITVRQKLLKSFDEGYSPGQYCVIPLSGGLDSRAVLGGLLQFTEASNIVTYTYGIPGSYDYEIASQVARKVGVHNIRISLDKYRFTLNELLDVSRRMNHQAMLFFHAPLNFVEREFAGGVHWSGFLGEAITGDHIRGEMADSVDEAQRKFLSFNRFLKGDYPDLLKGADHYTLKHLEYPDFCGGIPSYEEAYDLMNRQNKYIAPHILPCGFEYRTPLNNPAVIGTFLGLNEEQKRDQTFFKAFLRWWKPGLFDLPVKNNLGMPLGVAPWRLKFKKKMMGLRKRMGNFKNPGINYFDFSNKIREDEDLKKMVVNQLAELKYRKILPDVINPDVLWNEHQQKTADHGAFIQGLVSLEIHHKAGKELT